ncbi:MAG: hypothetical protein H6563_16050 [Lewinellaceae bacterium]|nr:hypothetical protein [Lewinellaceae bacterium]
MKPILILTTLILSITIACNHQLVDQLQTTHTQIAERQREMSGLIDSLVQVRNRINIQGRALSEDEIALVARIDALEHQWLSWQEAFKVVDTRKAAKKSRKTILKEEQSLLQTLRTLMSEAKAIKQT